MLLLAQGRSPQINLLQLFQFFHGPKKADVLLSNGTALGTEKMSLYCVGERTPGGTGR